MLPSRGCAQLLPKIRLATIGEPFASASKIRSCTTAKYCMRIPHLWVNNTLSPAGPAALLEPGLADRIFAFLGSSGAPAMQEAPSRERAIMQYRSRRLVTAACAALTGVSITALTASEPAAQYKMTVNKERLINAANEPQNWLMMNGDYGSNRYSRLPQINRNNVKTLRLAWALALGGMQDVGQNGPENEVHPLIDNGFMYTSDGWGTLYKIDARDPNKGEFVWVNDLGVRHEGNEPRTRGIALWEELVIASLPDGRVVAVNRDSGETVWDKKLAGVDEFGRRDKFDSAPLIAEGKVVTASFRPRGWLAGIDAKTGNELWRWYAVPKPGDPGSESWKDDHNAWKTGGGSLW